MADAFEPEAEDRADFDAVPEAEENAPMSGRSIRESDSGSENPSEKI